MHCVRLGQRHGAAGSGPSRACRRPRFGVFLLPSLQSPKYRRAFHRTMLVCEFRMLPCDIVPRHHAAMACLLCLLAGYPPLVTHGCNVNASKHAPHPSVHSGQGCAVGGTAHAPTGFGLCGRTLRVPSLSSPVVRKPPQTLHLLRPNEPRQPPSTVSEHRRNASSTLSRWRASKSRASALL